MSSAQLASVSSQILVACGDRLEVELKDVDLVGREMVESALEGYSGLELSRKELKRGSF